MGQPYYYYYELDGSVEAHDPTRPTTSACPYLPGQTVNMMHVPAEMPNRKRSASLSSVREEDFKTMDPNHKYIAPRPVQFAPGLCKPTQRAVTSQAPARTLKHKRSDRSISPTPSWWSPRKLFGRKNSTSSNDRRSDRSAPRSSCDDLRRSLASSSSSGSRTRAMSPESLRKFLSDDVPVASEPMDDAERLFLAIPDDIAEEDDDNFATSAISENGIKTYLSPPPVSRNHTPPNDTLRRLPQNESVVTLKASKPQMTYSRLQPAIIDDITSPKPISRFSFSSDDGSVFEDETDSTSPDGEGEIPAFYHSEADEDDKDSDIFSLPADARSRSTMGRDSLEKSLAKAFTAYHLPFTSTDGKGGKLVSAPLVPRDGEASVSVVSSPPLLAAPVGSVVDDFVSEMSGCIRGKWV
ncbi:hypothetical protein VM1G_00569 [Cytospora mali]|uniref:Uncharacterized protein n=1 Tax=Cytospora mali TaxID=578113 RepID=A0A194VNQ4_CYTMA|nr:hypothetical protein VM1G_00569 [Valsa mali]